MKYSTLIFDFGGVIINIDFNLTYEAFKELGIQDLDSMFAQHQQNAFFDKFEKGLISPSIFRNEIRSIMKKELSDEVIDQAWNKMLLDIPSDRVETIKQLKKQYCCVLLSNTNQIHYDYYRHNFEHQYGYTKFSDIFHDTFFSHEMGMRKPDTNIYQSVLSQLDEKPENVLFIDDTEKNIVAAEALGINTLLWNEKDLSKINQFV